MILLLHHGVILISTVITCIVIYILEFICYMMRFSFLILFDDSDL